MMVYRRYVSSATWRCRADGSFAFASGGVGTHEVVWRLVSSALWHWYRLRLGGSGGGGGGGDIDIFVFSGVGRLGGHVVRRSCELRWLRWVARSTRQHHRYLLLTSATTTMDPAPPAAPQAHSASAATSPRCHFSSQSCTAERGRQSSRRSDTHDTRTASSEHCIAA
jgi:hypothetical protein